jgi:O-antigen/teichoic acid export membrane protein
MSPDTNRSIPSKIACWLKCNPTRAGAIAGWLQQAISLLVAVLLIPVVTRYLPAEEAGIWFAFQSIMAAIAIVDMGFGFAISRQVAFTSGAKASLQDQRNDDFIYLDEHPDNIGYLSSIVTMLYFRLAIAAALLACIAFEIIAHFGQLIPYNSSEIRLCWYTLALGAVVSINAAGQAAILNGLGLVYQTRILTALQLAAAGIGAAVAAAAGMGLVWMAASFALASMLYWAAIAAIRRRMVPVPRHPLNACRQKSLLSRIARVALPVGGVNVFGFLVYGVQTPLLGFLLGPSQVAPFYLAQKISTACTMFTMHIALPRLPLFTRMVGANNTTGAAALMLRTIKQTSLVTTALALAFYVFSPSLANILLNGELFVDGKTLLLMAVDLILLTVTVTWGHFVLASGRNPFVISTILTGISSVLLSVWLISLFGITGLPLATILSGLMFNYRVNLVEGFKTLKYLYVRTKQ